MHNLHLLTKDGKYNLMANILSDSNSFSIKVARFQGKDKTKLIKRNEYGYKCLLLAIKQVLDYAEALNETTVELVSAQRKETKLFDFACFREAWLNACLHNKWSKLTPPAVYFFDDRIEIISTGGLPVDYSQEDFFSGRSRPVNLELQQIMVQLQFIEQTGHGVPLIVSKYGKKAFDLSDNFITVTIPLNHQNATVIKLLRAKYDGYKLDDSDLERLTRKEGREANQFVLDHEKELSYIDNDRLEHVLIKLARSHAVYELYDCFEYDKESRFNIDLFYDFKPFIDQNTIDEISSVMLLDDMLLPEMGAKMYERIGCIALTEYGNASQQAGISFLAWNEVQENEYRYTAFIDKSNIVVKIIIQDFLYAKIIFVNAV